MHFILLATKDLFVEATSVHVEVLTLSSLHGDNMLLTVGWEGPRKTTESSTQLRQLRDRAKQGSVILPQFNSFTLNDFRLFLLVIMSQCLVSGIGNLSTCWSFHEF